LAASGTYRFQAVIEEQDDVVTLLSVLPDKSDRIEFPTNHIPDKAEIGSIISFEIAKYDNPDIKTWTRVTENVIDVHDGDTITLANGMKIRILPINAPELKNPDGTANPAGIISGNVLRNMILDKFVDCYIDPTNPEDKFGRTLAYVYRNGVDLGQWMMDNGYAVLYRVTNAWFANICVGADLKYTSLEPLDEFSDLTPDKHFVTIKVPNFFMPFPADFEDIVFIRASLSESVVYKTDVVCFTDPPPGYAELHIEPDKVEVMVMDLDLLKKYIPSPCGKRVRVTMRRYFPCETTLGTNDSKAMYDHITDNYSFFNITAPDFTVYIIKVPTDKVPANVSLGDELIFTFTEILPYVTVTAQVTEITPPNVWLVHGTAPPYTFYLDQSLIPFPISVDDRIGIELGKNIGDYYSADFHARLGNNVGLVANFIKLPENVMPINIPLRLVDTVVQDPDLAIDPEKIQINDTAYFKILDKSFTNSFHARLEIIEGVNGIWKILPDEKTEITIPSTVAEEYFTTEKYSQYPSVTFSIKLLKDQLVYDPNQQIQIVSTDVNNTTIKFLHLKFGTVQATIPTRLFSWLPAVNDEGIFKMTAYSGLDSEKMYVDSISESEAKLISMTKKDISLHYPIDKLPQYLKRFDTVRLQIRTNGWTMVPSGQVAQDIVDKYTKTTTTKSGTVKRKVPARIPDTLDMFVIVRSLDNGYGDAMTERTDNNGWVDIPVFILPWDTDVGDTLSLNVSLNFYREIHFAARFMSLTMDGVCSFLVDPSMNFPFSVPLSWIPVTSAINDIIGFTLTKKVAGDTFDATHKITAITYTDITLQGISDGKIVTFDRTLLPYVMLPPPNYNITNLKVYTEFRLVTKKIS
jgi:endonuclease YncB( thermonuclease family)